MGIVLKGFDSVLNRYVAIKVRSAPMDAQHGGAAAVCPRGPGRRGGRARARDRYLRGDSANESHIWVMPFIDGISLQDASIARVPLALPVSPARWN